MKKRNKKRAVWLREYASIEAKRKAENSTPAMKLCAVKVRRCLCSECLHYAECLKAQAPTSRLGAYMAWLEQNIVPMLRGELYGVNIDIAKPYEHENAYAVVCVKKGRITISRILLKKADYDAEAICCRVKSAYWTYERIERELL